MPTNIEQTYVLEMPITSPDISLYRTETNRRSEILLAQSMTASIPDNSVTLFDKLF